MADPCTHRVDEPFSMAVLAVALSSITLQLSQSQSHHVVKYTTYERIGKKECPDISGTSMIYSGVTFSYKTANSFTGFRCMSTDIKNVEYYKPKNESIYNSTEQIIIGDIAEYKTFTGSNNYSAACAVCMVEGRGSIVVLPGTYKCLDPSWTMEYMGYLMTGNTCVDKNMTVFPLTPTYAGGPTLKHEVVSDKKFGQPYMSNKVLSCVVCSK